MKFLAWFLSYNALLIVKAIHFVIFPPFRNYEDGTEFEMYGFLGHTMTFFLDISLRLSQRYDLDHWIYIEEEERWECIL